MNTFNGSYFDGKTSRAYPCYISIETDCWYIAYFLPSGETQTVRWENATIEYDELRGSKYIFRYGEFPKQSVECTDKALLDGFKVMHNAHSPYRKFYENIIHAKVWVLTSVLVALFAIFMAVYWFALPAFAAWVASQMPMEYEVKLGDALGKSFTENLKVDSLRSVVVTEFAHSLDFQTSYPLRFAVAESDIVNAFALPGGQIVIFSALLDKLQTPEELAALLGHEVAHVKEQHSLKAMARGLSGYLLLSLVLGDFNGIAIILAEHANTLRQLSYSRELETQADEIGMKTLQINQLDNNGMVRLFQILESETDKVSENMSFLNSHPLTADRIALAKAMVIADTSVPNPALQKAWQKIKNYRYE